MADSNLQGLGGGREMIGYWRMFKELSSDTCRPITDTKVPFGALSSSSGDLRASRGSEATQGSKVTPVG